ncbi:MAG: hypothetical protein IPP83_04890 [Flavobacteriales bacterium]|nr:hypothetical protein [Flavobacteriales bacterium]
MSKKMKQPLRTLVLLACLIGASTQAQWNMFSHDGFQSIFSIATTPGAIHMISFPNGVITSVNGGANWAAANTGLPAGTTVESVGYNGTSLYVGSHGGVYKSTNAGGSWALANTGLPATSSNNFAKKFYKYGTTTFAVYSGTIGAGGGVWRTTDDGVNWFSGNGGLSSNMTVYQIADIGGVLWAATSTGLAYSLNLGVGWTYDTASNFTCFGVQGTASRMVILSTFGYRYRNYAGSWGAWQDATGDPTNPSSGELILYDGMYWAISGGSPSNVLRSTNNGQTWANYNTGIQGADVITQYAFHAAGTTLYMGTLTHLYGHTGTTTSEAEVSEIALPRPYPTLFTDGFSVDLSGIASGQQLVLIDAMGREVKHVQGLSSTVARIERGVLPAGTYRVLLLDPSKGTRSLLGAVVAQ